MKPVWQYLLGLTAPLLLWGLFVGILIDTLRYRLKGDEDYDAAALREWVQESRLGQKTLPELVGTYLQSSPDARDEHARKIQAQLEALGDFSKMYQVQSPLFTNVYHMEIEFQPGHPDFHRLAWDSNVPRREGQANTREVVLYEEGGQRAVLRIDYLLHAFNKRQQDELAAYTRFWWVSVLTGAGTVLAFLWILWIYLAQRRDRERELQQAVARQQVEHAERLVLENELRRQEAEHRREEMERKLLEQQLATQAAERQALELKSQLYASIGIMAGSYAHNIKNLLVRPNDLLRRCLEADGLSSGQERMLHEVRQTLGTVTERLQQILRTVRRDPARSEMTRLDLNALLRDVLRTWEDLAWEKWKLTLTVEVDAEPLWIDGDLSHLQQAVENLLFNARDATFEMRNHLREQAHQAAHLDPPARRQALIDAAAWKGSVALRTRRQGDRAVLEIQDNGIGMDEETRRRCTETHFTTKRDNALYEGYNAGMGLGLSFVVVILEHHGAGLEIESQPLRGALFRARFPVRAGTEHREPVAYG